MSKIFFAMLDGLGASILLTFSGIVLFGLVNCMFDLHINPFNSLTLALFIVVFIISSVLCYDS